MFVVGGTGAAPVSRLAPVRVDDSSGFAAADDDTVVESAINAVLLQIERRPALFVLGEIGGLLGQGKD